MRSELKLGYFTPEEITEAEKCLIKLKNETIDDFTPEEITEAEKVKNRIHNFTLEEVAEIERCRKNHSTRDIDKEVLDIAILKIICMNRQNNQKYEKTS